ncbi:SDR family oxidoreductase [Micromonospora sp. NPDC002717]|uniref:SDR family oxidoreductase n=1 Tax=Micromonospora sp. NPDC002717 TaxID=3154424 RepID=UPI003328413C
MGSHAHKLRGLDAFLYGTPPVIREQTGSGWGPRETWLIGAGRSGEVAIHIAVPVELEVTSLDSIEAAFGALEQQGRVPDVVVNNVGVSLRNSALNATAAEFDLPLGVNLRGMYLVAQRAARAMPPRGGGPAPSCSSPRTRSRSCVPAAVSRSS